MEQKQTLNDRILTTNSPINNSTWTQSVPKSSKNIQDFTKQFFNIVRSEIDPSNIQKFLINHRNILSDKLIMDINISEPKLYNQFRYLMLALSISTDKSQKWATFYEIINSILKIPNDIRNKTKIQKHVIDFTYFLLDQMDEFFEEFQSAKDLILKPSPSQNSSINNEQWNKFLVKKIVKIFNSLLCLKFITIDDLLLLIYHFGVKSYNFTEFLVSIQENFVKRMIEFQKMQQSKGIDSEGNPNNVVLDVSKIYVILHIFYNLDLQNKLRDLLKQQLGENHEKAFKLGHHQIQYNKLKKMEGNNQEMKNEKLLKFVIKQILKNKDMQIKIKKQFIVQCFIQISEMDEQFVQDLLDAYSIEQNDEISETLIKYIERQALNFISVSRLRSILKIINLSKQLSYKTSMCKIQKILHVVERIAKKFNTARPTYQLQPNSSNSSNSLLKISNMSKASMIIFSVDFFKSRTGRVIQLQINKILYDVFIKYSQTDSYSIEIKIVVDGVQKCKEKKEIRKWCFVLFMISLVSKQQILIMVDGKQFEVPLKKYGSEITTVQFGPFYGSIKYVYILDKISNLKQMNDKYEKCFRKMDLLLDELGHKDFIYSIGKPKKQQIFRLIWTKKMEVDSNLKKLGQISFGQGLEQLGGFRALFFLASRIVTNEKSDELVNFLIKFFELFKVILNQCSVLQALKLTSMPYFGQFLWLILNKNGHLRNEGKMFNKIFLIFQWYHKLKVSQSIKLRIDFAIMENIYLNFQIWSICSFQIKKMLFAELQQQIKNPDILYKVRNNKGYQKIMSSIVFSFRQQKIQQDSSTQTYFQIPVSSVHTRISKIGEKLFQLYCNEKRRYDIEMVKKDMNIVMGLIYTFFYKKHQLFSKGEKSALATLLLHYNRNFRKVVDKDEMKLYYTDIINQFATFIEMCPLQCDVISMLFEIGLDLIVRMGDSKSGVAIIVDAFICRILTHDSQELQFAFKVSIFIIKKSRIIYETNSVFDNEQIISVLLGSLRNAAQKVKHKLKYQSLVSEFNNFEDTKFKILMTMTQFYMVIEECVDEDHIFPIAVNFIKCIIENSNLFPEGAKLAMNCFKIIINGLPLIKNNGNNQNKQKIHQQLQGDAQKENKQNQAPSANQSFEILKQILSYNNLQVLYKNCRSSLLLQILIKLDIYCLPITYFEVPIKIEVWESNAKNYGGDLTIIFNLSSLSTQQLVLLIELMSHRIAKIDCQDFIKDILFNSLPLVILYNAFLKILSSGLAENQVNDLKGVTKQAFFFLHLKQLINLFNVLRNNKNKIFQLAKIQNNQEQNRKSQILNISKIIFEQYQKNKNGQNTLFEDEVNGLKNKLSKQNWSDKFIIGNQKEIKYIMEKMRQIIDLIKVLVQAVSKTNTKIESDKSISISFPSSRKRQERLVKKNKNEELQEKKKKQQYKESLKKLIKELSIQFQEMSKKKQKMWKDLIQKNKFWSSTKIKNNQCYEIDPKITGFYKLNIVKRVFGEVPYPRRKSFEHQLEQQNAGQAETETKKETVYPLKPLFTHQFSQISEEQPPSPMKLEHSVKNQVKQQIKQPKQSFVVEYVTQKGVYAGILLYDLSENYFIFKCLGYSSLPDENVYKYSTIYHRKDEKEDKLFQIRIRINQKSQIFARRYIHRHTAIQIFSYHQTYFFNLFLSEEREKFFKIYSNRIPCIVDLKGEFEKRKYTQKWRYGKLDNFEYLMLINMFSGRTYNDLGQYPVVPWVLKTFTTDEVQLNKQFLRNQKNVRDLSKPIGKISDNKFKGMLERYNQIEEDDYQSKFLYGTMYSNPTVIYNFFIRLQPFTTLHWEHQGRRIDHADRLFSTVYGQFNTILTSTSDNKELVPEFYYWPEFLKNRNKVNLGTKQNKEEVDDVILPGWSKNPQQFIFKMRQVLESAEVSKNLHKWIDLIFGYKSSGEEAIKSDNIYHWKTYEHDIFKTQNDNINEIKTSQITISEFGQIPFPIFSQAHLQKQLFQSEDYFKLGSSMNLKKPDNPEIKILQMSSTQEGFFIAYNTKVQFYPIQNTKFINFTKPDKTYDSNGQHVKLFDFRNNIWFTLKEGIFRIFEKKKLVFEEQIEAQCFALYNRYIIFGYRSELVVKVIENRFNLNQINSFSGHKNKICHIEVNESLDIVLSIDEDGLVLIHEFEEQRFLREFDLETKEPIVNICIHEMGYFIFLTKDQKLIIFNFLGELFFNQSIGITNKLISEQITKIKIFSQNRSLLLVSTNQGKIYLVDFLQIKRFNENCVYKQFSRFKISILDNCPRLPGTNPNNAIKNFFVKDALGEKTLTYRIYVLYENNSIVHYYPAEKLQQKIKSNKTFNSLFEFEKTKESQGKEKSVYKIEASPQ